MSKGRRNLKEHLRNAKSGGEVGDAINAALLDALGIDYEKTSIAKLEMVLLPAQPPLIRITANVKPEQAEALRQVFQYFELQPRQQQPTTDPQQPEHGHTHTH